MTSYSLPSMNSSTVAFISCISASERPQEGPGGNFDFDLFLRDPTTAHLEAEPPRGLRPDSPALFPELVRRSVFDVGADREALLVRVGLDGVSELRRVDEGLPSHGCGPDRGLPSLSVRALALPEPLKRRLSGGLGEGCVEVLPIEFRVGPHSAEQRGDVAVESYACAGHGITSPSCCPD